VLLGMAIKSIAPPCYANNDAPCGRGHICTGGGYAAILFATVYFLVARRGCYGVSKARLRRAVQFGKS